MPERKPCSGMILDCGLRILDSKKKVPPKAGLKISEQNWKTIF